MTGRMPLPLCQNSCLGCGMPLAEPHAEGCLVEQHDAALAGDNVAEVYHDPDECPLCLMAQGVNCRCRCGHCCEGLIIEATAFDARLEPRIRERCGIIDEGGLLSPEEAGWLLNGPGGPCVFFHRDSDGLGVCEIHETRPLVCRLFDCDRDERAVEFRLTQAKTSGFPTPEGR